MEDRTPEMLVIDFQNVKILSSTVISSLLICKRYAVRTKTQIILCEMSRSLRNIFRSLKLDGTEFTICDSVREVAVSRQPQIRDVDDDLSD